MLPSHLFPPLRHAVFALTVLLSCTASQACRFQPDLRPWSVRIAEVRTPVFVGHVTAVRERAAVFAVERGSKHSRYEPGQEVQVPVGESSCDLRFTVGQRWLYAGPMLLEPNRLLENGPLPLDVQAFLEGAPPARLQPGR